MGLAEWWSGRPYRRPDVSPLPHRRQRGRNGSQGQSGMSTIIGSQTSFFDYYNRCPTSLIGGVLEWSYNNNRKLSVNRQIDMRFNKISLTIWVSLRNIEKTAVVIWKLFDRGFRWIAVGNSNGRRWPPPSESQNIMLNVNLAFLVTACNKIRLKLVSVHHRASFPPSYQDMHSYLIAR